MPAFTAQDPRFEARVRASFARQQFMATLGARLLRLEPGLCEIELEQRPELTQQHGYLHAGAGASIADSAGGYAGYSLMPANSSVLSVEFKLNLLEPAQGQRFVGRGARPARRQAPDRVRDRARGPRPGPRAPLPLRPADAHVPARHA